MTALARAMPHRRVAPCCSYVAEQRRAGQLMRRALLLFCALLVGSLLAVGLLFRHGVIDRTALAASTLFCLLGVIYLALWFSTRRVAHPWRSLDGDSAFGGLVFVPVSAWSIWAQTSPLAWYWRLSLTAALACFICGGIWTFALRGAPFTARLREDLLGPLSPSGREEYRAFLRHRRNCPGRHEIGRLRAERRRRGGARNRRVMRASRRWRLFGTTVQWWLDPYCRPAAWLAASTAAATVFLVVGEHPVSPVRVVLVFAPFFLLPPVDWLMRWARGSG